MESYLRPRRGKASTAISQGLVLKRGEVFFEYPEEGICTGPGKIKMGDGTTSYSALPYFIGDINNSTVSFTDSSGITPYTNNTTYLNNIKPSNSIKDIFTNLKQLLVNFNSQLNDKASKKWTLLFSGDYAVGNEEVINFDENIRNIFSSDQGYSEVLVTYKESSSGKQYGFSLFQYTDVIESYLYCKESTGRRFLEAIIADDEYEFSRIYFLKYGSTSPTDYRWIVSMSGSDIHAYVSIYVR